MTYREMLNAINGLSKIASLKLPMKKSYRIYQLLKKIDDAKEFFIEKERELIETYHGTVDEKGQINFANTEDYKGFSKDYSELNALSPAIDIELPIAITFEEMGETQCTPADFSSLEGIISFE